MRQTTCQIARETGIHHSPVYSIIHQDFQLKCLKKLRAQNLLWQLCTLVRLAARVTRYLKVGRVGAHKLGEVGNTI